MSLQYCGVSVAIQAKDMALGRTYTQAMIRDLVAQLQPELRRHVGGVQPRGDFAVNVTGPHSDPLQGRIYVLSLAVPVETDDLPADCSARVALYRAG